MDVAVVTGHGDKTSLILLPGLLNDADLWRDQIEQISDLADIRVADLTKDDTIPAIARRILAAAPATFCLAGFSLGGMVAQEILRQAPSRVERLALLDTRIRVDSIERRLARMAAAQAAAAQPRFNGFGPRTVKLFLGRSHQRNSAMIARIREMTQRLGPEVMVRQYGLEHRDGEAVLSRFKGPLLILCGDEDRVTPLAAHEEMFRLAPHARLSVIRDSGHMTPIEQPDLVTAALRQWLLQQSFFTEAGELKDHSRQSPGALPSAPGSTHAYTAQEGWQRTNTSKSRKAGQ